ncbi:ccr4 [Symbiodinium natans]|uniref:Ccr4 protein n=1 Tax=Symbiodinium natans TaxID=878477 RepID=A0A812H5L2_9DINO|nr:ccr4 [Symbiodinium natans]
MLELAHGVDATVGPSCWWTLPHLVSPPQLNRYYGHQGPGRSHSQEGRAGARRHPRTALPTAALPPTLLSGGFGLALLRRRASAWRGAFDPRGRASRRAQGGQGNAQSAHVRVVTYNVLSPTLCSPNRFPHCRSEDLLESFRWPRLIAQLEAALADSVPTVFCLQEVDELWAGKLHAYFQRRGWHFAYAMTPLTYFPPIGVALAFPSDIELEEIIMVRPAGQLKLTSRSSTRWQRFKDWLFPQRARDEGAAWVLAARKQNRLLAARLKVKCESKSFIAATYHMPCLFDEPVQRQAKAIHAMLLRDALMLRFPQERLVLAGDFNTKPEDSELEVLMEGQLSEMDVAWPAALEDQGLDFARWQAGPLQLHNAYAHCNLDYTNYAWIEGSPAPFRATLDYIFTTSPIEVVQVLTPPQVPLGAPVLPTAEQPSDHVLLAADLSL